MERIVNPAYVLEILKKLERSSRRQDYWTRVILHYELLLPAKIVDPCKSSSTPLDFMRTSLRVLRRLNQRLWRCLGYGHCDEWLERDLVIPILRGCKRLQRAEELYDQIDDVLVDIFNAGMEFVERAVDSQTTFYPINLADYLGYGHTEVDPDGGYVMDVGVRGFAADLSPEIEDTEEFKKQLPIGKVAPGELFDLDITAVTVETYRRNGELVCCYHIE